ncbi:hypothetical protein GGS26DRAFT_592545 [Hypomontagnella submonticulosa]|nr:hypothetical protein GGS26DRAFT_592545 [Hypomontagnella submonticulosa]
MERRRGRAEAGSAGRKTEDGNKDALAGFFLDGRPKRREGLGTRSKAWPSFKKTVLQRAKKMSGKIMPLSAKQNLALSTKHTDAERWLKYHKETLTIVDLRLGAEARLRRHMDGAGGGVDGWFRRPPAQGVSDCLVPSRPALWRSGGRRVNSAASFLPTSPGPGSVSPTSGRCT